jgi:hypothetical protein
LRARFEAEGVPFHLPDLNRPSFERLSLDAALAAVDELDDGPDRRPWGLVGSSLGGWIAARWAELHPARVARLVLLCPAFDLARRWPALLPEGAMERWREQGSLRLADGAGVLRPVHYGFYEEACREPPTPGASQPTLLLHGRADERVPIESSRGYARKENVRLVELDDGHDLGGSVDRVVAEAFAFLRVDTPSADP